MGVRGWGGAVIWGTVNVIRGLILIQSTDFPMPFILFCVIYKT